MGRTTGRTSGTMSAKNVEQMYNALAQIYSAREGVNITIKVTRKPEYQDKVLDKEESNLIGNT